jgi:hypothetical protein
MSHLHLLDSLTLDVFICHLSKVNSLDGLLMVYFILVLVKNIICLYKYLVVVSKLLKIIVTTQRKNGNNSRMYKLD